jgi:hypothetical protein
MDLSDFFNSINQTKKNIMNMDPSCERIYVPFVVNKSMSYFADSLFQANFMNRMQNLPKRMQYDYYLHSLSKKSRYSKWHKDKEDEENINIIKEYYGYSTKKAKEASKILSQDNINRLQEHLKRGGNVK